MSPLFESILKIIPLITSGLLGLIPLIYDLRDYRGKLTLGGKITYLLIALSTTTAVSVVVFDVRKNASEALQQKTETLAVLQEIKRAQAPLGNSVMVDYTIVIHPQDPSVHEYMNWLDKVIASQKLRSRGEYRTYKNSIFVKKDNDSAIMNIRRDSKYWPSTQFLGLSEFTNKLLLNLYFKKYRPTKIKDAGSLYEDHNADWVAHPKEDRTEIKDQDYLVYDQTERSLIFYINLEYPSTGWIRNTEMLSVNDLYESFLLFGPTHDGFNDSPFSGPHYLNFSIKSFGIFLQNGLEIIESSPKFERQGIDQSTGYIFETTSSHVN